MTAVTITVTGINEAVARFGRDAVIDAMQAPMRRGLLDMQAFMQRYPPQRAGSPYRRTMTLGRRWTVRVERTANGLRGTVGNNTSYGPFVQSSQFQARVHRGRWQTDTDAANQLAPVIISDFQRVLASVFNG